MSNYLQINGFRTNDPELGPVIIGQFDVKLTKNQLPIDKIIENIYVRMDADYNSTSPLVLSGDLNSGHVSIVQNDEDGTVFHVQFTIADSVLIDSGKANQKYILQLSVLWDDNTLDRVYGDYVQFNPGL